MIGDDVLVWREVRKGFGRSIVLDRLDMTARRGRSLVILGASGQGKSVALKLAAGLLQPDAGQVLIEGRDLARQSAAGRKALLARTGMLFQGAALFDSLPVWENVAFRLLNAERSSRAEGRARALLALRRVRLDADVADKRPSQLSGGMQKRVGLARAIVADPELLFFDEPTTGLDPITARAIDALILDQVRRLGCTAVTITHDIASARRIGDDIALLGRGRILWRGPAAALDRPEDPALDQFVHGRAEGPLALAP